MRLKLAVALCCRDSCIPVAFYRSGVVKLWAAPQGGERVIPVCEKKNWKEQERRSTSPRFSWVTAKPHANGGGFATRFFATGRREKKKRKLWNIKHALLAAGRALQRNLRSNRGYGHVPHSAGAGRHARLGYAAWQGDTPSAFMQPTIDTGIFVTPTPNRMMRHFDTAM